MTKKKFEDIIAEKGKLIYTAEGDSMFPIIKPRDLLVIEKIKKPLKLNDVPLYKRDSGQYVLHRIVEIKHGKYITKGDNRNVREKGITDRHIIGVLTAVIRNGRKYPVETLPEHEERVSGELIYLLSCAANREAPDKDRVKKMDLSEIYRMSHQHFITSAVSFALEQVIELPRPFDQAKKKAIRKLTLFETERANIFREFEKAKIWHLPLKGILLKDCYPKTAMREMSDNDVLTDPERMDDVRKIMEGLGYTCDMFGEYKHDVYSKPPTLEFEMHHSLFLQYESPLFAEYFSDIKSKTFQDRYFCRLSDEDFYIYILCHTYNHYIRFGTGLRSLLDNYVFLKQHRDLDRQYLDKELEKLELTEFERKIRLLSIKVFTGSALSEAEKNELMYYVFSGSYGNAEIFEYNKTGGALSYDDSKAAKRRYLWNRVFIPPELLEESYPFFAKHKALYPALLGYRIVKGAVFKPKGVIGEYKTIMRFKKRK